VNAVRCLLGACAALVLLAAPLRAQGLGDTAAREKSKRTTKGQKKDAGRVFNNDDLEAGRPPGWKKTEGSAEAAAPAADGDAGERPVPAEDDRLTQERPFLDAINAADAEVTRVQGLIKELQDKLNPMSTSYIFGASGSNDANEELRVREELRQAERDMTSAREQAAAARKTLEDFRQGRPVQRPE
jgi:hypothetical protein